MTSRKIVLMNYLQGRNRDNDIKNRLTDMKNRLTDIAGKGKDGAN